MAFNGFQQFKRGDDCLAEMFKISLGKVMNLGLALCPVSRQCFLKRDFQIFCLKIHKNATSVFSNLNKEVDAVFQRSSTS